MCRQRRCSRYGIYLDGYRCRCSLVFSPTREGYGLLMGGDTMWQVNPLLLRKIDTLRNKTGTNSWSNFAGCWLVAVDTRVLLVALFIQMLTILFVAATASRVAVEIQLWLTSDRVATAIPTAVPLFTVDIQLMLMQFHQGWLHVSLVAVVTQLWLMRRSNSNHWHRCTRCFYFADCCGY